ncbi:MAG: AAA family ATPase [Patescibacteria group bacterium]
MKNLQGKIIAIVGAPRAGKSFLAKKLAQHYGAEVLLEGEEADFPPRLKEDIKENIRPLERMLWFRNKMVKDHMRAETLKKEGRIVVMDTFWMSLEPYIPILTEGFEREICQDIFEIDAQSLGLPDLVILLQNSPENTRNFLRFGKRDFDSGKIYSDEYIVLNQEMHNKAFSKDKIPGKLIVLDRTNIDFEKMADMQVILKEIEKNSGIL